MAEKVCLALETQGIVCWIAPRDIFPGQSYGAAIVTAIREAQHFILIFSGHANSSSHVENEVERAFGQRLTIHPLRLDQADLSPELEYFLSRPQWFDLFGATLENRISQFVKSLVHRLRGKSDKDDAVGPRNPAIPPKTKANQETKRPAKVPQVSAGKSAEIANATGLTGSLSKIVPKNIRVVRALSGHRNGVKCVAFSPDGQLVASGSGGGIFFQDNTVRVWRAKDGKPMWTLQHESQVNSLVFSPDGSLLASGGNDGVLLWTAADWKQAKVPAHAGFVNCLAFSSDGKMLAVGSYADLAQGEAGLELWRIPVAKRKHRLAGHSEHVNGVAFSPSGRILASGASQGDLRLWNTADGRLIETLTTEGSEVTGLAFSTQWGFACGEPR